MLETVTEIMKGNFSLLNVCLPESLRLRVEWWEPTSLRTALLLPDLLQRGGGEAKEDIWVITGRQLQLQRLQQCLNPCYSSSLGYQCDAGSSATWWDTDDIYPAAPPLFLLQAAVTKAWMVLVTCTTITALFTAQTDLCLLTVETWMMYL